MTELLVWADGLDEVTLLRVAYTVAGVLGLPCALFCLWASVRTWAAIKRRRVNGGLERSARGYLRRDRYRAGILALVTAAGLVALVGNLSLRSVFGLVVLLLIAVLTTHDAWSDYHDRRATVDAEVRG